MQGWAGTARLCIFGEVWVPARRRSTLIRVGSAPASRPARPYFWIDANRPVQTSLHVAFACGSRELVDGFHAAALAAGGADNGPAGPRPIYHPDYYGAFVLDPDGNNVEAVCHRPA